MSTMVAIFRRGARLSAAIVAVLLAGGCASLNVSPLPSWPDSLPAWPSKKDAVVVPQTVAVVWTPAVLQKPGAVPTRGLGGLVTFYGADRNTPVKVDGQLTVYAYKEAPGGVEKVKPDVKYVFPPEQLAGHYGQSKLGHSYSIWIPWDPAGGPRQTLTLTACFQPNEGDLVAGMPARVVLEGQRKPAPPSAGAPATAAKHPGASPESGGSPTRSPAEAVAKPADSQEHRRQMSTTTLSLPRASER